MEDQTQEIEEFIIRKLVRHGYLGGSKPKHTPIENVPKGLPRSAWGTARKVIEKMIREQTLLRYKTGHGIDVYLNLCSEKVKKFLSTADAACL